MTFDFSFLDSNSFWLKNWTISIKAHIWRSSWTDPFKGTKKGHWYILKQNLSPRHSSTGAHIIVALNIQWVSSKIACRDSFFRLRTTISSCPFFDPQGPLFKFRARNSKKTKIKKATNWYLNTVFTRKNLQGLTHKTISKGEK